MKIERIMKNLIRKTWSKLVPKSSENANRAQLEVKYMPYDNAYFFTHVPKTGGTSFIVFLDRFFPAKVIFPHQLWMDIGDFSAIDKNAFHLIRGHYGGGSVDLITDKSVRYLTILRDPVKLAYSTYEFVKRETNTALHPLVMKENMSFETFLEHPKTKHLVTNRMVHNLVYGLNHDDTVQQMTLNKETFPEFRRKMNKGQADIDDESRIELSKEFIDNCLWFGILEDFNHAVRLLCYKMAWPPMGQSQKLNINRNPPVISEQARAKALEMNHQDSELYQYALEKFNHEVTQMYEQLGGTIDDDPETLDNLVDQHYQNSYRNKNQIKLQDHIDYDFSEILLGGQWHRREWDAFKKRYFRWSGPGEQSYIDFWVKPRNYKVIVYVIDAVDDEILNNLKIKINDHELAFRSSNQTRNRMIEIDCKKVHIKNNGLLRLSLCSTGLKKHKDVFGLTDNRVVGFAVNAVKITPR